jgi:hypothetical protein
MKFYWEAEEWDKDDKSIPHTDANATVTRHRSVQNVRVIHTTGARYRNAVLEGTFVLTDAEYKPPKSGWYKVNVYCCWFSKRLKTRPIRILVQPALTRLDDDYSGEVASNISR